MQQAVREAEDCRSALAEALSSRGFRDVSSAEQSFERYQRDCQNRADQAREAAKGPELVQRLSGRRQHEQAVARAAGAREAARQAVQAAARRVGLASNPGTGPRGPNDTDGLVRDLEAWQQVRTETLRAVDEKHDKWVELQTLLDGANLADLQGRLLTVQAEKAEARRLAEEAMGEAKRAAADLESTAVRASIAAPVGETAADEVLQARRAELRESRQTEQDLEGKASGLEGQVTERATTLPGVAESEESLARAQTDLERVQALQDVLDRTETFLEEAQDRVFRDIAPVLVRSLDKWLPVVTAERYTRSTVDPETLEVRVASPAGDWRNADLLSVGTKEQVYLLLRIALAEHLAKKQTVSPLLLDDVTVQADPTRTAAILGACKVLAEEGRQIVLFAQEPSVADWATENLSEPPHKLIRLSQLAVT